MIDAVLRRVAIFADLSDEHLDRLCSGAERVVAEDGELEIIKSSAGREVLLAVRGPERG